LALLLDPRAKTGTPKDNFATTTFGVAELAVYENDYFNNWWGRFYAGTHKDITFSVTDFVKTSGVVTFAPAVTGNVDATDLFELIPPDFSPDELKQAINLAITMVENEALVDKVDESVGLVASTFEYAVPSGFVYIDDIFQESGTADRYRVSKDHIDVRHWAILRDVSPKLWFDANLVTLTAGRNLRIIGQGSPGQLTLDADSTEVSLAYLINQAKANLHFSRADSLDDTHHRKMVLAQTIADRERQRVQVAGRGRRVTY
tara:strand:+ start:442 stop:1221 length:780 start_codon:yes stop_codon:yes gene_type:complete